MCFYEKQYFIINMKCLFGVEVNPKYSVGENGF